MKPSDMEADAGDQEMLPWSFDRPLLTPGSVEEVVHAQFPSLAGCRARKLGEGWSFEAFELTQRSCPQSFVFRFPKRREETAGLLAERRALLAVAERFELAVPRPEFLGHGCAQFPYPFNGYRKLEGKTIFESGPIADAEILRIFDLLRTFHVLPVADARLAGLPVDVGDAEDLCAALADHVKALSDPLPSWLMFLIEERLWQEDYPPDFDREAVAGGVLVHADFFDDHLLFDEQARATAVLDWTDLAISDPAVDLAGLIFFFGFRRLRRVIAGANDVHHDTWCRARYFARANILLDVVTLRRRELWEEAAKREQWLRRMLRRGDFGPPRFPARWFSKRRTG